MTKKEMQQEAERNAEMTLAHYEPMTGKPVTPGLRKAAIFLELCLLRGSTIDEVTEWVTALRQK